MKKRYEFTAYQGSGFMDASTVCLLRRRVFFEVEEAEMQEFVRLWNLIMPPRSDLSLAFNDALPVVEVEGADEPVLVGGLGVSAEVTEGVFEERSAIVRRLHEKADFYESESERVESLDSRNLWVAMANALRSFALGLSPPDSSGSGGRAGG